MEGKTKASQAALACASEATRKLNPHLFKQACEDHIHAVIKNTTPRPKTRIRQDKPMNRLEQEAWDYIRTLPHIAAPGARYSELRAQSKRFRLASGLWYKPDITGRDIHRIEYAWEVKGPHAFRGGFENLKMAATQYPEIRWILMWKVDGQWQFQEVLP